MTQAHIFYSGMVQGVGFRYTVERFASSGVFSGWVRNLRDGRVEVLVEGEQSDIEKLMRNIEDHFGSYIRDKEVSYSPAQGQFKDFSIAF